MFAFPLVLAFAAVPAIDNAFVVVTRGESVCAVAESGRCGDRVIVALQPLEVEGDSTTQRLGRGEVAVFGPGQSYRIAAGSDYFEVVIRPDHPAPLAPAARIEPEKNATLYDAEGFFVFEEKLDPGDTRARHSHSQRVVIQLNRTRLQQWPDGAPEMFVDTVPERPSFSPPVVHRVKNVGDLPLAGIIIEFKPR